MWPPPETHILPEAHCLSLLNSTVCLQHSTQFYSYPIQFSLSYLQIYCTGHLSKV